MYLEHDVREVGARHVVPLPSQLKCLLDEEAFTKLIAPDEHF
jgi:hypothetical protein